MHQSEGQFFTPIPIARFLVSSLPLRQILEGGEIPKVIDYACGAGHFLTEYARQIKPIVEEMAHLENIYDKRAKEERLISVLREYYEQIVGIEKLSSFKGKSGCCIYVWYGWYSYPLWRWIARNVGYSRSYF